MSGDPAVSLDYLFAYYRGIFFATVALKGRLAKGAAELRPGVREVGRYQTMARAHLDALQETIELHRQRATAVPPATTPTT